MKTLVLLLLTLFVRVAVGQESGRYASKTSYSVFTEYSNDSSHMIIGASENRKLFAAGVDYNRRIRSNLFYSWQYQVEVVPIELLRDPKLTTTVTSTVIGYPTGITFPVGTYRYSALQQKQCASRSDSGTYFETDSSGDEIPVGTFSYTNVCSDPWTYGGGISPLGQKVNFLPGNRVQPYVALNAGFVAFAKTIPADSATMFNFSFEFGGGIEWSTRARRSWALDYRYHHVSNAGRGVTNPGVDNGTFRLSYSFER